MAAPAFGDGLCSGFVYDRDSILELVIESIPMLLPFTCFILNSKSSFASNLKKAAPRASGATSPRTSSGSFASDLKGQPRLGPQESSSSNTKRAAPRTSRATSSRESDRLRLEPQEGNVSQEGRPFGTHGLKGQQRRMTSTLH
ncbi:hypothetical protein FSHL1_000039 [Fusarium sambucinum]